MSNNIAYRIEEIQKSHKCYKCKKRLVRGNKRINFILHNYCFGCGYYIIKEEMEEMDNFLMDLKRNYGKEIAIERLTK